MVLSIQSPSSWPIIKACFKLAQKVVATVLFSTGVVFFGGRSETHTIHPNTKARPSLWNCRAKGPPQEAYALRHSKVLTLPSVLWTMECHSHLWGLLVLRHSLLCVWSFSGICRRFSGIPITLLSMVNSETLPIHLVLVGWEALSVCCICFACVDGSMFPVVFVSFVANTELRQERVMFSWIYEYMMATMFSFWLFFEYVTFLVLSSWLYFCCLCCSQLPVTSQHYYHGCFYGQGSEVSVSFLDTRFSSARIQMSFGMDNIMLFLFIEKLALELGYGSPFFRPRHAFKVSMPGFRGSTWCCNREKKANRKAKRIRLLVYVNFFVPHDL